MLSSRVLVLVVYLELNFFLCIPVPTDRQNGRVIFCNLVDIFLSTAGCLPRRNERQRAPAQNSEAQLRDFFRFYSVWFSSY